MITEKLKRKTKTSGECFMELFLIKRSSVVISNIISEINENGNVQPITLLDETSIGSEQ